MTRVDLSSRFPSMSLSDTIMFIVVCKLFWCLASKLWWINNWNSMSPKISICRTKFCYIPELINQKISYEIVEGTPHTIHIKALNIFHQVQFTDKKCNLEHFLSGIFFIMITTKCSLTKKKLVHIMSFQLADCSPL